jgi:hypothetical protein
MKSSRNGSNGHGARVDVHDAAAHYQLARTFTEISQTVVSSVVSTPCRLIDVLEHRDEGNLVTPARNRVPWQLSRRGERAASSLAPPRAGAAAYRHRRDPAGAHFRGCGGCGA